MWFRLFPRRCLYWQVPLWFETSAFRPNKPVPRNPGGVPDSGARRKALKGFATNLVGGQEACCGKIFFP